MKKILVISSYPAPYRVAVFRELAQFYSMDVFFEFIQDQSRAAQWFVRSDEFKILNTRENQVCFRDCLKKLTRYDLVLAYDYNNTNAGRLIRTCIRKRVPYIINCDGAFIRPHWLKDRVKHYYISHARACFASGAHARDYFLHYGAREENIYLHQFTSMTKADMEEALTGKREDVSDTLGLPNMLTVLTIGQFIPRKGFDILLQAWKTVQESLSQEAQLVLVGGGGLEKEYERLICELGLTNVHIQGFVDKKTIFSYYHASDVFVLPTREDIWGLVINEAMACGLPVISTDRCIAAVELIQDDENGYVVPHEDVDACAAALIRVLSDESLRENMEKNNREKICTYTLENIAESHRRVIDSI